METTRYRNRFNDDRIIEAVQYARDNDREVYEWAPDKQHVGPHPDYRIDGMNVFTPGGRVRAVWGDWIYRDEGTERFWVSGPDAFVDSYEQMPEVA